MILLARRSTAQRSSSVDTEISIALSRVEEKIDIVACFVASGVHNAGI